MVLSLLSNGTSLNVNPDGSLVGNGATAVKQLPTSGNNLDRIATISFFDCGKWLSGFYASQHRYSCSTVYA